MRKETKNNSPIHDAERYLSHPDRLGSMPPFYFYYAKQLLPAYLEDRLAEINQKAHIVQGLLDSFEKNQDMPLVEKLTKLNKLAVPMLQLIWVGLTGSGKTHILGWIKALIDHVYQEGNVVTRDTHFTESRKHQLEIWETADYNIIGPDLNANILRVLRKHDQDATDTFKGTGKVFLGLHEIPAIGARGFDAIDQYLDNRDARGRTKVLAVVADKRIQNRARRIREYVARYKYKAGEPGLFTTLEKKFNIKLPPDEFDDSEDSAKEIQELFYNMAQTDAIEQNRREMVEKVREISTLDKKPRLFSELNNFLQLGFPMLKLITDPALVDITYWLYRLEVEMGLAPGEYDIVLNFSLLRKPSHFNPKAEVLRVARGGR